MMNHTNGWMLGWSGGGIWLWMTAVVVMLIVLAIVLNARFGKKTRDPDPFVKRT